MCGCQSSIKGMKKKKSTRRRARVRGLSTSGAMGQLEQVLLITAGAVGSAFLKEKVDYLADPTHKTIAGAILTAAGIGATLMLKSPVAKSLGMGVAINGAITLGNSIMPDGKQLPQIGGIGIYPAIQPRYIANNPGYNSGSKVRLG